LPGEIIQSMRGSGTPTHHTPSPSVATTKSTSQSAPASATPVAVFTDTPVLAVPSAAPAYPGGEIPGGPIPSQTNESAYPLTTLVVSTTPDLGATNSNTSTPTSGTQGAVPGAYPGLEVGQATLPADNNPYPGESQVTASGSEGSYPLPGSPAASATPQNSASPTITLLSQTQPPSSTPVYAITATSSPTPILVSPTTLSTSGSPNTIPTILSSPTATFFVPTETPTPTRTPFLTPTPTVTSTPTPTRTPLPVPPWVSVQLHATNPHTVQLAAGKPQLIEFFAFWSGPSLAMAPVVQGVEKEYSGRVNFVYLDIDDPATDIFKQVLRYRVEPHFFLLDAKGIVLQQWIGYVTVEQFRQALDSAIP
jgi:thiol-disulfide isomerase/thioredoxin